MADAQRAWIEVRVDGVERWRLGVNELDEAVEVAGALLDDWPQATIEVVRCEAPTGTVETLMLLRYPSRRRPE